MLTGLLRAVRKGLPPKAKGQSFTITAGKRGKEDAKRIVIAHTGRRSYPWRLGIIEGHTCTLARDYCSLREMLPVMRREGFKI